MVAGGPAVEQLDDDPEAQRLRRVALRAGVADRVVLLGRVSREAMPALFRSADVVVAVPWYEPFGIVPLEAMACGRPVVATAVGGMLDSVLDGVTGLLVPPKDPKTLGQRLRGLLDDRALRRPGCSRASSGPRRCTAGTASRAEHRRGLLGRSAGRRTRRRCDTAGQRERRAVVLP